MPSTLKVRVEEARGLPVMDRASKLTDAYVEIKFAGHEEKTDICRKSLDPKWRSDFRFEVRDDAVLQDCPIEFRVMDKDWIDKDDSIGVVYVDLNTLLGRTDLDEGSVSSNSHVLQGWFPIYDTFRGVCGQLKLTVRLQWYGDVNPFRDSSAGVQYFSGSTLDPRLFTVQRIFGFVEELIVADDPEYSFVDNFRAARLSNDARQLLLHTLSSKLKRHIGKKVLEQDGNAVLAYQQHFDIEGDSGIVARGYGTCVLLQPVTRGTAAKEYDKALAAVALGRDGSGGHRLGLDAYSSSGISSMAATASTATASPLSTPTGEGAGADGYEDGYEVLDEKLRAPSQYAMPSEAPTPSASFRYRLSSLSANASLHAARGATLGDESGVRLLTLAQFPAHVRIRIGGAVAARSVKYLGKLASKLADQDTRDSWWSELRAEVRSNARALQCTVVLGYTEITAVHDDVLVLSASGTAAALGRRPRRSVRNGGAAGVDAMDGAAADGTGATPPQPPPLSPMHSSSPRYSLRRESSAHNMQQPPATAARGARAHRRARRARRGVALPLPCSFCHVPYSGSTAPFAGMRVTPCQLCHKKWVPEVLLATIEPPPRLAVSGSGKLVEARVCRPRRQLTGDANAGVVSDALPFVEYELQRQLVVKLKVMGMNAAFAMQMQIQLSTSLIVGVITATACYVDALPRPAPLVLRRNIGVHNQEDRLLVQLQQHITELSQFNQRMHLGPKSGSDEEEEDESKTSPTAAGSDAVAVAADGKGEVKRSSTVWATVVNRGRERTDKKAAAKVAAKEQVEKAAAEVVAKTEAAATRLKESKAVAAAAATAAAAAVGAASAAAAAADKALEAAVAAAVEGAPGSSLASTAGTEASATEDTPKDGTSAAEVEAAADARDAAEADAFLRSVQQQHRAEEQARSSSDKTAGADAMLVDGASAQEGGEGTAVSASPTRALGGATEQADHEISLAVGAAAEAVPISRRTPPPQSSLQRRRRSASERSLSIGESVGDSGAQSPARSRSGSDVGTALRTRSPSADGTVDPLASGSGSSSSSSSSSSSDSSTSSDSEGDQELQEHSREAVKEAFIVEIDDETDEDLMSVLLELRLPEGIVICNTDSLPAVGMADTPQHGSNLQLLVTMRRAKFSSSQMHRLNQPFAAIFSDLYSSLLLKLRRFAPCAICGLRPQVSLTRDDMIEVVLTGMVVDLPHYKPPDAAHQQAPVAPASVVPRFVPDSLHRAVRAVLAGASQGGRFGVQEMGASLDDVARVRNMMSADSERGQSLAPEEGLPEPFPAAAGESPGNRPSDGGGAPAVLPARPATPLRMGSLFMRPLLASRSGVVELTPLSFVPGTRILRYLGRINMHFIKESSQVREGGGLGGFFQLFLTEVNAMCRAHVKALGGNACIMYKLSPCESNSTSRNQTYNMISVSGDAVLIERVAPDVDSARSPWPASASSAQQ